MKHFKLSALILFIAVSLNYSLLGQTKNDLVSCNLQLVQPVAKDSTVNIWSLVNSYTTEWGTALELQPNKDAKNDWVYNPWMSNATPDPQAVEMPYIMGAAVQTRSNPALGVVESRLKVCVYIFAGNRKK